MDKEVERKSKEFGDRLDRIIFEERNGITIDGAVRSNLPPDLAKGIDDYYKGKGISIELLKKYYGFGEGMTVGPTERQKSYPGLY